MPSASDNDVRLQLLLVADEFNRQMAESAAAFKTAMRGMGSSLGNDLDPAARRTSAEMGNLQGKLREHLQMARGTARATSFFSRELAGIGLASTDAAGPLARLLGGFAMGGPIGLGIGVVSAMGEMIGHVGKESKEAFEEMKKHAKEANVELQKMLDKLNGISEAQRKALDVEAERKQLQFELLTLQEQGRDESEMGAVTGFETGLNRIESDRVKEIRKRLVLIDGELATRKETAKVEREIEARTEAIKRAKERAAIEERAFLERLRGMKDDVASEGEKGTPLGMESAADFEKRLDAEERAKHRLEEAARKAGREAAAETARQAHQAEMAWVAAGNAAAAAWGDLANAIGGQAGKTMKVVGEMIQQMIRLAIAVTAASGPAGWIEAIAMAASLIATISSVPKFERGTSYVPETGLAMLHRGEQVIPAGGGVAGAVTFNVSAVDARSVRRMLRRERAALAREIYDLARDRRRP